MDVELRHNPSNTVARCRLAPRESLNTEGGAMLACSAGVDIRSSTPGGFLGGLKRSALSAGSFYVTTYTAPDQGGWVDLAGKLPGDVITVDVADGQEWFVGHGSWLGNSPDVTVDPQFGGMKQMFGGQGAFGYKASGRGHVLLGVYGAIDVMDLGPGERVTIDTGHVVAYHLAMTFDVRRAVQGKTMQTLKSGEGLVFDFTGPGHVLLQTRNPRELERLIDENRPRSS
jgi:uncharacterized protein (TIGR00266 family)